MHHSLKYYFRLTFLCLIFPTTLFSASVYKWTDEAGEVHYSDKPLSPLTETIKLTAEPEAKQIENAKQREIILRNTANDLQSNRLQRESRQQKLEQGKQKQQRKEKQQARENEIKKEEEQREGNNEGHYQKQWQQQMPSQRPLPQPLRQ